MSTPPPSVSLPGPMRATIRLLERHELDLYLRIRREALVTDPDAFGETLAAFDARPGGESRDWFASAVGPERRGVLVAEEGGVPRGMCGFGTGGPEGSGGYLWGVFVSPAARRTGVGARLVARALDELEARGATTVRAKVAAPNRGAVDFYRAIGFTVGPRVGTLREGSEVPVYGIEWRPRERSGDR